MKHSHLFKHILSIALCAAVILGLSVSALASDHSHRPKPKPETEAEAEAVTEDGAAIVETAMEYLGAPYVWGGTTPAGFDCSGFVQYVFGQCGYEISRTADTQYDDGEPVEMDELIPGDLVFFERTYSDYGITHVGIYIGDGQFIHAGGSQVKITDLENDWYSSRYYGACRIAG